MIPEYLYKYRQVNQFTLMSLINRSVWFSKAPNLNDPFDCQVHVNHDIPSCEEYKRNVDIAFSKWAEQLDSEIIHRVPEACFDGSNFSDAFSKEILGFKKHVEATLKETNILALSEIYDSTTMWSHYGDSHKGICIEYESLKLFPNHDLKRISFKVDYDSPENITYNSFDLYARCCANRNSDKYSEIVHDIISTKTDDWAYEKEWRIINAFEGNTSYGENAIKSIFFGLKSSSETKCTIRNILKDVPMFFFQMVRSKKGLGVEPFAMDKESRYWHESTE